MKSLPEIVKANAAGNGKDNDVEVVHGNPTRKSLKTKARAEHSKNPHLPGMQPKTVPSVHRAIEEYVEVRDARMKLTEKEVEKKAILLAVMKKAGLADYAVDGHEAHVVHGDETVKARIDTDEAEQSEEDKIRGLRPKDHALAVNPPPRGKGRGRGGEARA